MTADAPEPSAVLDRVVAAFPERSVKRLPNLIQRATARFLRIDRDGLIGIVKGATELRVEVMWSAGGSGLRTACSCRHPSCEHALLLVTMHRQNVAREQRERRPPKTTAPEPPPPRPQPRPAKARQAPRSKGEPPSLSTLERLVALANAAATDLDEHAADAEPVPLTFRIDAGRCGPGRIGFAILMPKKDGRGLQRMSRQLDPSHCSSAAASVLGSLCLIAKDVATLDLPTSTQELEEPWASQLLPALFRAGAVQMQLPADDAGASPPPIDMTLVEAPAWTLQVASEISGRERLVRGRLVEPNGETASAPVIALLDTFVVTADRVQAIAIPQRSQPLARDLLHRGELRVPLQPDRRTQQLLTILADGIHELQPWFGQRELPAPEAVVRIQGKKRFVGKCMVEVVFDYGGVVTAFEGEPLLTMADGTTGKRRRRSEERLVLNVLATGRSLLEPVGLPGHALVAPDRIGELIQRLGAAGLTVHLDDLPTRAAQAPRLSIRSDIDWFDLDGVVPFAGGGELPLAEALAALERGETTVTLPDGATGLLPVAALRPLQTALRLGERHGTATRLHRSQLALLDALLGARAAEFGDEHYRAARDRLLPPAGIGTRVPSTGFAGTLRPYQQHGLAWLHFLRQIGLGGCLADDMGLGKTVQVLALLHDVHAERSLRPSLLVVPRSLLGSWQREAQRFTPSLRVLDFHGSDRWQRIGDAGFGDYDIVLTTYGTLRSDGTRFEASGQRFEYVILDEAQAIENERSATSKVARLVRAEHRLAMTGTPVMNHLGELWALFEFLNPGLLGRSAAFRKLLADARGDAAGLSLLHRALAPFLLRRTKAAVLTDLPPKQELEIWCEMDAPQERTYGQLRDRYQKALLHGAAALAPTERFQVLEALLRLRQAACHEALVQPGANGESAKFDALLPMLKELAASGHKALVFSQFTELLGLLRPRLEEIGLQHEYLDGSTRDRQQRVDRFQQDAACPLFLVSLKAGGVGLNLTAADYVFLLDPWWNPAAETQASDRAHRIGQTRKVTVYRLVTRGTVEEKVLELQARKRELVAAVLGADQSLLGSLTRADLAALLG
jgi:superfamily II DNA or RNA helicase